MIDHCVSAFKHIQEEKSFKIYVTDALQCISQGVAYAMSDEPKMHMSVRWADLIECKTNEPEKEDTRTVDEIVDTIWANIERKEDEP